MLRKLLVPVLATVALAGCATDYRYRAGNGDYYYGSPQVEYRYLGPPGYYGGYGGYYGGFGLGYGYGYGATYYYDPFGRLVYGYPGRYGYGHYNYRPRPHRDHDGGPRDHDDGDDNRHDQRPPWRNLGGLQPRDGQTMPGADADSRPRMRRQAPMSNAMPAPRPTEQRAAPRPAPIMRERSQPAARSDGFVRGGARARARSSGGSDE